MWDSTAGLSGPACLGSPPTANCLGPGHWGQNQRRANKHFWCPSLLHPSQDLGKMTSWILILWTWGIPFPQPWWWKLLPPNTGAAGNILSLRQQFPGSSFPRTQQAGRQWALVGAWLGESGARISPHTPSPPLCTPLAGWEDPCALSHLRASLCIRWADASHAQSLFYPVMLRNPPFGTWPFPRVEILVTLSPSWGPIALPGKV